MSEALGIQHFWLFFIAGLIVNVTPGADTLLVVSRSAGGGWRAGVAAAFGIQLGCLVHALAAALGVAALLAASATAFRVLTWLGAAYLAWLGWQMLYQAWRNGAKAAPPPAVPNHRTAFAQGLLTNLLNPKVGLFFMAFVPQFVRPDAPSPLAAFLTLGVVFDLTGGAWLILVATLTARLKKAVLPWASRALKATGGALFLALAWRLATERRVM